MTVSTKSLAGVSLVVGLTGTLAGCGSDPGSGDSMGTAFGSVDGKVLSVVDGVAVAGNSNLNYPGPQLPTLVVELTDFADACTTMDHPAAEKANGTALGFIFRAGGAPIATGTYPLVTFTTDGGIPDAGAFPGANGASDAGPPAGRIAIAFFDSWDAQCNATVERDTGAGTVQITDLTDTRVAGTYDARFAGGSFSGSFDVPRCDIDIGLVFHANVPRTCVP